MATVNTNSIIFSTSGIRMADWFTSHYADALVDPATPTKFSTVFSDGNVYNYRGTGFTYGGDGFPDGGTINSVTLLMAGQGTFTISGLSLTVSDFNSFMTVDDAAGLLGAILGGDDLITGGSGDDNITALGGADFVRGGAGDDILNGGSGDDKINLGTGNDQVQGGFGDDYIYADVDEAFSSSDSIDGGLNKDTVLLRGDYSAGLTITGAMMTDVEKLVLQGAGVADITLTDDVVAAGKVLTVDTLSFASFNEGLVFDGSAETDGRFKIYGSFFSDNITTGNGNDYINVEFGLTSIVHGGGGNDTLDACGGLDLGDQMDGGTGDDVLLIEPTVLAFAANTIQSVERIVLEGGFGFGFDLTFADGNVAAGETLTIDGHTLASDEAMYIDGHQEMDGSFSFNGGAGDDVLIGGRAGNTFRGGLGSDQMVAGTGVDVFVFGKPILSTGPLFDTIDRFDGAFDKLQMNFAVTGLDATVRGGTLTTGQFNSDLETAIGATQLAKHHAVLFQASSGDYGAEWFLIVDHNGIAGYQADHDVVIGFTHQHNIGQVQFI